MATHAGVRVSQNECPDREPGAEAFSCRESGGGEEPQLLGLRPPRCEDDR